MCCLLPGCRSALVSSGFVQPSAQSLDARRDFDWRRDTTRHFVIRIEAGLASAQTRDSVARGLETARTRVVRMLELPDSGAQVNAFAVADRGRVRALLGRDVDGRAFFGTRVFAFAVDGDWPATARHELTHVLLRNAWPGEPEQWLNEGMATYVGDHFYGRDVHRLVQERLIRSNRALAFSTLMRKFSDHPDEVTYLQSASVVKFLHARFGLEVLRAAWRGGADALVRATGSSLETLESQWRQSVEQAD